MYKELLESSEFYQKRYHNFSSLIIIPTFILFLVIIVFLMFMPKEITLKTSATVEPTHILSKIQSTSSKPIIRNNLKENQTIRPYETLIEYESTADEIQNLSSNELLYFLQYQRQALDVLKLSFETGSNQFLQDDGYGYRSRFEEYINRRATLSSEIEQQNTNISNQNNLSEVKQAQNTSLYSQLASLQAQKLTEVAQEMTALDEKIIEASNNSQLAFERLSNNKVSSKKSGIIHLNPEFKGASIIPEGSTIAFVYPNITTQKKVNLEAYIPSKDITTIALNDKVYFKFQDTKNQELTLTAQIREIDSAPTKNDNGNYFKIVATASLDKTTSAKLKYGMEGSLVIITGQKSYFTYYKDKFFD